MSNAYMEVEFLGFTIKKIVERYGLNIWSL